jgi:RecA/RadA recombinase
MKGKYMSFEQDNVEEPEEKAKREKSINELSPEKPSVAAKSVKEDKLITSDYSNHNFSDDEINAANDLVDSLTTFLEKKCDIKPTSNLSTIPSGIDLYDAFAGGGISTAFNQIIGPTGCGKSSFSANLISTGQKKWPGKFIGIYIDSEYSMTTERLAQLGVRYPKMKPYSMNTVERVFQAVEGICSFKEEHPETLEIPSIIVWDSIANTLVEKAKHEDSQHSVLGLKAALLTHLLPKYVEKCNNYNISLFAINQLRDKIEMGYGHSIPDLRMLPDKNIPGGKSLIYNTVQLFYCRQSKIFKDEYGFQGGIVKGKFIKNKLFTPNVEFEMSYSFEHGFSNFWTNYELLKKFKWLSAAAGRVKLKNYKNAKSFFQKQSKQVYDEDEEFRKAWHDAVEEVIQTEIIEKYKSDDADDKKKDED